MPKSVLSRGRKFVARLTALAMVASIMVIGAAPASAAIDTSTSCPSTTASAGFTDIGGFDATTQLAINCLVAYDISNGTSATTFSPAGEVDRWQMALFLTRQAEVHGLTLPSGAAQGFTDIGTLNAETQTAINQLAQLEITQGTSATTFSPFDVVTRWQMALFLTRLVEAAGVTLPSGADQGFTDIGGLNAETQMAINQLAQLDIADGTSATTYSPLPGTLRWQMALFLTRTLAADGITPTASRAPAANVGAPQLVSVARVNTTVVRYTFDEDITGKALDPGFAGIRLYAANGTMYTPTNAAIQASGTAILAEFAASEVSAAALATVQHDVVEDAGGISNVEGSQPLLPSAISTPAFPAQLIEVDNFRVVTLGGGGKEVRVDFTFADDIANPFGTDAHNLNDTNVAAPAVGEASEFTLIGFDGTLYTGVDIVSSSVDATADTVTVTISLTAGAINVPESEFRRGIVWVSDTAALDDIVLSQAYSGATNSTDQADLVSVSRSGNTYTYTFDEAVSNLVGQLDANDFYVAAANFDHFSATTVTRSNTDTRVVTATFAALPTSGAGTPVVGYVDTGAVVDVQGGVTGPNNPDEVVLTVPSPVQLAAGETSLPDLLEVRRAQNLVSEDYRVTFVFDNETVDAATVIADIHFDLYDQNGLQFRVSGLTCATAGVTCSADGTTITLNIDAGFTGYDNEDIAAARVGAVETDVVAPTITEGSVSVSNA